MAKQKTKLTKNDVIALAKKLAGTTDNVFVEADRMFGISVGDEIFDRLRKTAGLIRCEECSKWQDKEDFGGDEKICNDCMDKIGDDGEE